MDIWVYFRLFGSPHISLESTAMKSKSEMKAFEEFSEVTRDSQSHSDQELLFCEREEGLFNLIIIELKVRRTHS